MRLPSLPTPAGPRNARRSRFARWLSAVCVAAAYAAFTEPLRAAPDPRLQTLRYDADQVVTVLVRQGVVTHLMLDEDEAITEVGAGAGGDCTKPESAWCIAAQPGGRHLFIKPRVAASQPNNLAVVTTRRTHAFRLVVLPAGDSRSPVYRLAIQAPPVRPAPAVAAAPQPMPALPILPPSPSPTELVAQRLQAAPLPVNWQYSLAEGENSQDIVPTAVFDDGRFTYLRFPHNREVPAVFHVLGDGAETLVNARMEGDLLVVDRVSRRMMLRAGTAVVGLWNEAFDLDGAAPVDGTTVPGVQRVLRAAPRADERPLR